MITDKQIEEHALKMGYDGKITPYIRGRVLSDLGKTEEVDEVAETVKTTTKTKSPSKKRLSKIGGQVGRGIKRTAVYISDCDDRYREYNESAETTSKKKPKGKRVKKVKKSKKTKLPIKTKTTRKPKPKGKSLKSVRKTQEEIDDAIISWM